MIEVHRYQLFRTDTSTEHLIKLITLYEYFSIYKHVNSCLVSKLDPPTPTPPTCFAQLTFYCLHWPQIIWYTAFPPRNWRCYIVLKCISFKYHYWASFLCWSEYLVFRSQIGTDTDTTDTIEASVSIFWFLFQKGCQKWKCWVVKRLRQECPTVRFRIKLRLGLHSKE